MIVFFFKYIIHLPFIQVLNIIVDKTTCWHIIICSTHMHFKWTWSTITHTHMHTHSYIHMFHTLMLTYAPYRHRHKLHTNFYSVRTFRCNAFRILFFSFEFSKRAINGSVIAKSICNTIYDVHHIRIYFIYIFDTESHVIWASSFDLIYAHACIENF